MLVGITSFISSIGRHRPQDGLAGLIWMFGLAFLFTVPKFFFPGILVLIALSILVQKVIRW
ncbi:hypothetical protein HC891_07480 [Candidatus Gracilibacteria bacterium]|nr:hypothetical protein [Candidatus Gracilibacteria bacterium]